MKNKVKEKLILNELVEVETNTLNLKLKERDTISLQVEKLYTLHHPFSSVSLSFYDDSLGTVELTFKPMDCRQEDNVLKLSSEISKLLFKEVV